MLLAVSEHLLCGLLKVPLRWDTAISRIVENSVCHPSLATLRKLIVVAGIWLGLRELGQLIGSSIQLSLNVHTGKRGRVGYTTYLVLIALQCLGLPLAFLISPPHKVIRSDGSKLPNTKTNKSIAEQFRKWGALIKRKQFFLLIPMLVGFNWNSTYLGIYLVNYFSVRSRALASLTSGVAATAANVFWGWFFDLKYFSRPQLARFTWAFLAVTMTALFGWQFAMEMEYRSANPHVTLDWALPGFGRGFAVQVLLRYVLYSTCMLNKANCLDS